MSSFLAMQVRLLQILCSVLLLVIEDLVAAQESSRDQAAIVGDRVCLSSYRLSDGDTISDLLFEVGVGTEANVHRLYGPDGWVERNRLLNGRSLDEWQKIRLGKEIHLYWPTLQDGDAACAVLGDEIKTYVKSKTATYEIYFYLYKRTDGRQTVSQDLYDLIKPLNDADLQLNGPDGLLAKMARYNNLGGEALASSSFKNGIIALPRDINVRSKANIEKTREPPVEQAPTPLPAPAETEPLLSVEEEKIVAAPESASFEEIASLPPQAREKIPDNVIADKLDDKAIAKLDDHKAEAIPSAVVEEKAWDYSLFDLNKPGMTPLFKNLSLSTPSGYLGLRYGRIIAAPGSGFLTQLQTFGLLAELRGGMFDGLRLIYDTAPEISGTAEAAGAVEQVGFSKLLLGWAFAWHPDSWVDNIHLVPRVGMYNMKARYSPATKNATSRQVEISRALSTGLEVDVEWTRFFYTLRLWAGQDRTPELFSRGRSAESRRAGVDLFLKGAGFGEGKNKMSLFYLVYTTSEQISAIDKTRDQDGVDATDIKLVLPTAGLGLALTW